MPGCRHTLVVWISMLANGVLIGCATAPKLHDMSPRSSIPAPEDATDKVILQTTGRVMTVDLASSSNPSAERGLWSCGSAAWQTPERWEHGLTIILPGGGGTRQYERDVALGLIDGGHASAITIEEWTTGYWALIPYHLMALERNRAQARRIADKIVAHQDRHPGCPVTLIGYSGGGALAVLILESLPRGSEVSQAILLGATLSPHYDLRLAMQRTTRGVWSVHSSRDVVCLAAGTVALGTTDRAHTISAGFSGFEVPSNMSESDRRLYAQKLHQVPYKTEMARSGNGGGHFGYVHRQFVADWIAPMLVSAD